MIDINKPLRITIDGTGKFTLTPQDHVRTGGEGHVYRKDHRAIKVWDDPARAAVDRMGERLPGLIALAHPSIAAPTALVKDGKDVVIGYAMPWINGWDLPLAFTNDWRREHQFDTDDAVRFTSILREVLLFVHDRGYRMGDPNELNVLGLKERPVYIDVDSWLPPGFAATTDKVLPTIRDCHHRAFTVEADRFGFAVVSFSLLTGIHPYRGVHPDFKRTGDADRDLQVRMKANASVFDPGVKLPAAVRPFTCIPPELLGWYRVVFKDGKRDAPPPLTGAVVPRLPITTKMVSSPAGNLMITKVFTLPSEFVRDVARDIIQCKTGEMYSLAPPVGRLLGNFQPGVAVVNRFSDGIFLAETVGNRLLGGAAQFVQFANMKECGIAAERVWTAANRIFSIVPSGLDELRVVTLNQHAALLFDRKWGLNSNATVFGDGAAVYSALGASFLVIPQENGAVTMCRVSEFDGLRPLTIFARGRTTLLVMITKSGLYKRVLLQLDDTLSHYTLTVTDADDGTLNAAITPTGIVLRITSTNQLEVTVPLRSLAPAQTIDLAHGNEGRLVAGAGGVFWINGTTVYKLSMS